LSTPFQNRLVGTIMVAAAVIIFLPDLLDGKKKSNRTDFEQIPQAPAFTGDMVQKPFPEKKLVLKEKEKVSNEPAQDALLKKGTDTQSNIQNNGRASLQAKDNKTIKTDTVKTRVTPASKTPKITANNVKTTNLTSPITKPTLGQQPPKAVNKEAWVIQLGSFKHKSNVAELVAKLKKNGYTVFTKPIKTKQGALTKVFVGPELIKTTLMKKLPALKKLTKVQGKIARFHPVK
jgi:DedD protein